MWDTLPYNFTEYHNMSVDAQATEATTELTTEVVAPVKKKRTVNYLNNADILIQVRLSKEQGRMTNELAKMLMLLCQRYATKGSLAGYSYNEDMQSFALMSLCKTWATFDCERGKNPFAYYTQCIKNSFNMFLGAEKKQRNIRDALLVTNGLTPSYTYQLENGMAADEDRPFQFEPISTADHYDAD